MPILRIFFICSILGFYNLGIKATYMIKDQPVQCMAIILTWISKTCTDETSIAKIEFYRSKIMEVNFIVYEIIDNP